MHHPLSKPRDFLGRFHKSPEGRILFFALIFGIAFLFAVLLGVCFSDEGDTILPMLGFHVASGRLGGISKGLHDGASHLLVFLVTSGLELLTMLIFYPLAIYSSQEVIRLPAIRKSMAQVMSAAERRRPAVKRWGVPGLLFLNWLPIYLTGPLISTIAARLIGFSNRSALLIGAAGTILSNWIWIWTVEPVIRASGKRSFIVPVLVLATALGYALAHHIRHRKD